LPAQVPSAGATSSLAVPDI